MRAPWQSFSGLTALVARVCLWDGGQTRWQLCRHCRVIRRRAVHIPTPITTTPIKTGTTVAAPCASLQPGGFRKPQRLVITHIRPTPGVAPRRGW